MILVRLQGCNLRCPFCDTRGTWSMEGGIEISVPEIVAHVAQNATGHRWVLVTGGEPAMQDLGDLVDALHTKGYSVALETNGTLPITGDFDWVCVSPKGDVLQEALVLANEVKYIVKDRIPEPNFDGPTICLQPESQDPTATALCIEAVQERGWRLSIQLHKYLHLP